MLGDQQVVRVGGGAPPLLTSTLIVVLPVAPVASRTVAVSGCEPLTTVRVSYAIEIGPRLAVVVIATLWNLRGAAAVGGAWPQSSRGRKGSVQPRSGAGAAIIRAGIADEGAPSTQVSPRLHL